MGVKQIFFHSRGLRSDLPFLLLIFLTWLAVFAFEPMSFVQQKTHLFGFCLAASGFTYLILSLTGYFDIFRLLPRKSDVFLLMVAVPLGGLAAHSLFYLLGDGPFYSLLFLMALSSLSAFFIFGTHYLFVLKSLRDSPRRIVLETTSGEAERLREVVAGLSSPRLTEFLSARDLRTFLLGGRDSEIDLIVISKSVVTHFEEDALLMRSHLAGIPIVDYHRMIGELSGRVFLDQESLWGYLVGATPQTALLRAFSGIKFYLEPPIAALLAIIFSPLMLLIAVIIRFESKGPIFYRQVRTGYQGRNFTLIKFRSMYCDAERDGPQWSGSTDSRVTPFGRFLRKLRLDELPQLWNVLRSEMSFCGPRPERPEIYGKLMEEIPLFRLRTIVRPGITGWAQICSGYAASIEQSREKLEYDLYYIQNMSPRMDLIILIKTILVALGLSSPDRQSGPTSSAPGHKQLEVVGA